MKLLLIILSAGLVLSKFSNSGIYVPTNCNTGKIRKCQECGKPCDLEKREGRVKFKYFASLFTTAAYRSYSQYSPELLKCPMCNTVFHTKCFVVSFLFRRSACRGCGIKFNCTKNPLQQYDLDVPKLAADFFFIYGFKGYGFDQWRDTFLVYGRENILKCDCEYFFNIFNNSGVIPHTVKLNLLDEITKYISEYDMEIAFNIKKIIKLLPLKSVIGIKRHKSTPAVQFFNKNTDAFIFYNTVYFCKKLLALYSTREIITFYKGAIFKERGELQENLRIHFYLCLLNFKNGFLLKYEQLIDNVLSMQRILRDKGFLLSDVKRHFIIALMKTNRGALLKEIEKYTRETTEHYLTPYVIRFLNYKNEQELVKKIYAIRVTVKCP
ncbi:hypothetical protein ENBRE01_0114 [Enteropsectra breve]|nr:hypothetical protein ENBRE01_0114 [Enteropsectra breve]